MAGPADPRRSDSDGPVRYRRMRFEFPQMYVCLDPERVDAANRSMGTGNGFRDDFRADEAGGRGTAYIRAQSRWVTARAEGIRQLLSCFRRPDVPRRQVVVDLLGGDGLVSRVASGLGLSDLAIVTGDASADMVQAAWDAGLPAVHQRAERSLFRTGSVDGVLLAYGSHHIDRDQRLDVVREAHRVLRPGGVFVLHDFPVGSPVDEWFSKVVDAYSRTGHDHEHFTEAEIGDLLREADFGTAEVTQISDPYEVTGDSRDAAWLGMGEYLVDMYGLTKATEMFGRTGACAWAAAQADELFRYPDETLGADRSRVEYDEFTDRWRCVVPRRAVVGIGVKA